MMVKASHERLSPFESALAGGVSGAITRCISQPLDVLKIRFQLQLEPIKKGSKYSSVLQAFASIIKQEGLTTLWSGHVPAQILSISYGIVQFSTYEHLLKFSHKAGSDFFTFHRNTVHFTCGALSATFATIVSYPFDTIRTRLIAEEKTRRAYKGFRHSLVTMCKKEGFRSLFKGLIPTLGQIAPFSGIQFAMYRFLSDNVFSKMSHFRRSNSDIATISGNLLAGSLAGLVAKTAIYPFDLIKKRLQIQGFQEHRTNFGKQMYCNGILHCIKLTITVEGVLAMYKGYLPSMLKAMVVTSLHFAVYDEIKNLLLSI